MTADPKTYLADLSKQLKNPDVNHEPFNIVFHGHSIPCGYTVNRMVRPFIAYPHLVHRELNTRYPCAVMNAIVTGIGGECSIRGAKRMRNVLGHNPRIVTVDYGRNDMYFTVVQNKDAWRAIIESVLAAGSRALLLTPAIDSGTVYYNPEDRQSSDEEIAEMIRSLASEYQIGCADVYRAFQTRLSLGNQPSDYLSGANHPNLNGHEVIAREILRWFPVV